MTEGFWLSEAQFERISECLPADARGVARADDRRMISGIIHVLQPGRRWKDAPKPYGPHKTLYNRFAWRAHDQNPSRCRRIRPASAADYPRRSSRRGSCGAGSDR
jgi:transposase